MKKFFSILLFALLLVGIFTLGGCNDKKQEESVNNDPVIVDPVNVPPSSSDPAAPGSDPANPGSNPATPSGDPADPGSTPAAAKEAIVIRGAVGEKTVLNPAFDWTKKESDSGYSYVLKSAAGASVASGDLSAAHYELSDGLDYNTTYTLTATGKTSGTVYEVTFTTVAGTGAKPNFSSAVFTVVDPFCSHMVLQRGKSVTLKGKTLPGVLVTVDFFETRSYAVTDESGEYEFVFPARSASKEAANIELRLLRGKKLTIEDVVVGDVFLASGQSNMWWKLQTSDYLQTDVTDAAHADIRFYSMRITRSATPRESINDGKWAKINPSGTAYKDYSAIAFMTASMLGKALESDGVPIGIIQSAEGDTNIANWMSKEYYDGSVSAKNLNYNAMIYPLRHTELTGVIWYQGCNNSAKGSDYKALLQGLFANWRELFKNVDLPFYVVQLPCYNGDGGNNYDFSFVRESQLLACEKDEHAYLIATCDGGDPTYIHPTEKRYIAERIAKSVLSTLYGREYLPQGPTYRSHVMENGSAVITVNNGEGLTADGEIVGFMLAGADGKYFDATATIANGKIVVTSDKVASPVDIKYGFSKSPFLNIYNKDGFLMSPFRTDDHNRNIDLLDYREGVEYAKHPDGSAMEYRVVSVDGETGLEITKANDGKGYGALLLNKWGAIGFNELDIKVSVIGTNSGAELLFRIVEGSGEIWAISMVDDFVGKREVTVPTSAFVCVYNERDGVLDDQGVMRVEVMIKAAGAATVTVLGVKFTEAERTAPRAFSIREARSDGRELIVKYGQAGFASRYSVLVSDNKDNFDAPVLSKETDQLQVSLDPSLLREDTTYYVKVVAVNELGQTVATNSGFTVATLDRLVVASLAFEDEESFSAFAASKLKIKTSCLRASRDEKGLKINLFQKDPASWSYCIISFDKGANVGYDTLKIHLDLTEYNGDYVVIQLQNEGGDASYSYTLYSKAEGYVEIPLSSFKKSGEAFDGREMAKIAFNFVDYTNGGENDNVYISDIEFLKK